MIFVPQRVRINGRSKKLCRGTLLCWLLFSIFPLASWALPARLVLALDGVSYRDLKALQAGMTGTNFWGKPFHREAFTAHEGYFPVSRMISTFPSASDVAWTDIFGDRPLPGYQRTYFSVAANSEISINGVTTSMEHERQMSWQVENGFLRAMGYLFPLHTYDYEIHGLCQNFWNTTNPAASYYVYIRASDDAQHLDRDIITMLGTLDKKLQALRARYQAQTGRDLPIVILSDHGHNHAGRGKRVAVQAFLKQAGYHIAQSIVDSKDVVLPTVGIESWVEIHNAPTQTEALADQLSHLQGVDVLAAKVADQPDQFLVLNAAGERAVIDWHPANNSFRYTALSGDPLHYLPVVAALAGPHQLDADGFATADDWMTATMTHHYPLALERIVRGLTHNTLNPATILISLDNRYVNDGWLVQQGSRLVTCGSTHGGLDDINSDGIVLSNFTPTRDTSSGRVAGQFDDFAGVKDFRAEENGAEFITRDAQALTRIAHVPFDREFSRLADGNVFLRMWSPHFSGRVGSTPVTVTIEKTHSYGPVPVRRQIILGRPMTQADDSPHERIYAFPPDVVLEPQTEYTIVGEIRELKKNVRLFDFLFHTDRSGRPAAF
jgi:hypothetical protein